MYCSRTNNSEFKPALSIHGSSGIRRVSAQLDTRAVPVGRRAVRWATPQQGMARVGGGVGCRPHVLATTKQSPRTWREAPTAGVSALHARRVPSHQHSTRTLLASNTGDSEYWMGTTVSFLEPRAERLCSWN